MKPQVVLVLEEIDLHKVGVKSIVFRVFDNLKFKISESYRQN